MRAIIYNLSASGASGEGGGTSQVLAAWAPTGQQDGFDTATKRIDFRGTSAQLIAGFAKGNKADGGANMYISGVQIERESFGYVTATIYAQGFWNNSIPEELKVISTNYSERIWPFSNGGYTYILSGQVAGRTPLNPATNPAKPWRIRQILKEGIMQRQGAIILTQPASLWGGPPRPTDPRPAALTDPRPAALIGQTPTNLADPLLSTETGWVQQGFNPRISAHLDKVILLSWQDTWKWFDQVSE